jgi:hypothetical protein
MKPYKYFLCGFLVIRIDKNNYISELKPGKGHNSYELQANSVSVD